MPLPLIGMLGRAALMSAASGMGGARDQASTSEDSGDSQNLKGMKKNTDKMSSKGWVKKAGAWMGIAALLRGSGVAQANAKAFGQVATSYANLALAPFQPIITPILNGFASFIPLASKISGFFTDVNQAFVDKIKMDIATIKGFLGYLHDVAETFYSQLGKLLKDILPKLLGGIIGGAMSVFMKPLELFSKIKTTVTTAKSALSNALGFGDDGEYYPSISDIRSKTGSAYLRPPTSRDIGAADRSYALRGYQERGMGVHANTGVSDLDVGGVKEAFTNVNITSTTQTSVGNTRLLGASYGTYESHGF